MKQLPAPVIYGIGIALSKLVSLVTLPIVARQLGPTGYAQLDLAVILIDLIGLTIGLGLVEAAQRYLAVISAQDKPTVVNHSVAAIATLLFVTILALAIFMLMLVLMLQEKLIPSLGITAVSLAIVTGAANAFLMLPMMLFRLNQRATRYVVIAVGLSIASAIGTLLALYFEQGVIGILVAGTITHSCAALFICISLIKQYGIRWSSALNPRLFKYGLPIAFSGLAAFLYNGAERWFLAANVPLDTLGAYSASWKIAILATLAGQSFQLWWSPRRLVLVSNGQTEAATRAAHCGIAWITSICAGIAVIAPILFSLLFGTDFSFDSKLIFVLLLVVNMRVSADILNVGCFIGESTGLQLLIQVSTAIITISALIVFVPRWGNLGAAGSLLIGALFRLVIFYHYSQTIQRLNYRPLALLIMVSSGWFGAWVCQQWLDGLGLILILFGIGVFATTWLTGVFALKNELLPLFKTSRQPVVFGEQK